MGKVLVIKGADFSSSSLGSVNIFKNPPITEVSGTFTKDDFVRDSYTYQLYGKSGLEQSTKPHFATIKCIAFNSSKYKGIKLTGSFERAAAYWGNKYWNPITFTSEKAQARNGYGRTQYYDIKEGSLSLTLSNIFAEYYTNKGQTPGQVKPTHVAIVLEGNFEGNLTWELIPV